MTARAMAGLTKARADVARGVALGRDLLTRYGLFLVTLALIGFFSLLLPSTFPTALTFRSILSDKSIVAFVSLAQMIPLAANKFDLSVAYAVGLAHILSIGLPVEAALRWPIAVGLACAAGLAIGHIYCVRVG